MEPGLGAMPQHGFTEDVNFAALASAPPPPPPMAPPPCVAGPPPHLSAAGPPLHSVTGPPPPHSVTGPPPPHSVAGPPPPHSVAGPPAPHSVAGPPAPHSVAGPPPPPHPVARPPPQHSVASVPPHTVSGPPPLLSVAAPPPPPPPPVTHENNNFRRGNSNYYNKSRMNAKKTVVIQKCEICNIELVGQVVIDAHMKGSKHAKKLKAKELLNNMIDAGQVKVEGAQNEKNVAGIFKCDICNVVLNSSQQLDVHYAGGKHKAKISETVAPQVQQNCAATTWSDPNTNGNGSNESKGNVPKAEKPKSMIANPLDLVCTICNITVNSPQQLEQHLNSKKHQDRESGRSSQRPTPYSRGGGRGGRGGLGSQSRGGKPVPAKFTSLSSSFKSAGYSNSFIKPEGGVSMPANCGTNKNQAGPSQQNVGKSNYGNHFKNRGNFGSLTPYVNTEGGRGGYNGRGGAAASGGGWHNPAGAQYGAHPGYSGYEYDHYNYGYGYENSDQYGAYGMMQSGPPPTY